MNLMNCLQTSEKPWKSVEVSSPGAPVAAIAAAAGAAPLTTTTATTTSSCDANATILTPPPSPIK